MPCYRNLERNLLLSQDKNSAFCQHFQNAAFKIACSAGVLLVRANVLSSRSFIRSAMFYLQLE